MPYEIDSGYKTIFKTATPPVNWTKDTSYHDYTFRVVTGAASSGGNVDFSSLNAGMSVAGGTESSSGGLGGVALTTPQIAQHTHPMDYNSSTVLNFTTMSTAPGPQSYMTVRTGSTPITTGANAPNGSAHDHPLSITYTTAYTVGSAGDTLPMQVKYVDVIIAVRD